jgi:curli biogenesis system outer membrane secretion channel CsgG
MKKIILICTLALLALACKSTSATATKLDKTSQVGIKGNWQITAVTYPGSEYIKVSSFDLADSKCFVGSQWKFISNNNKGDMTLNSPSCTAFTSAITWFINKEGQFVMKILDQNTKARKVRTGFVLGVANQTETSFQLIDKIDVGGKITDVIYQFQKN